MYRLARKLSLREIAMGVIVVVALCFSAVSACACTHHQPQQAAEESASCHSGAHAEMAEATADQPGSDRFDADCNCFAITPVPAIVSKSENKNAKAEQAEAIDAESFVRSEVVPIHSERSSSDFARADLNYSSYLRRSGSSRAPPRL